MPYQYPTNIPRVAKHWSASQQQKCTAAANAVLKSGKSEQEAIFACIHAAGKTKKKMEYKQGGEDPDLDRLSEEAMRKFQALIAQYYAGTLTLPELNAALRQEIQELYMEVMITASQGRELTDRDVEWLNNALQEQFDYLDGFMSDMEDGIYTEERAAWRVSLYAFPRSAYMNYKLSPEAAYLMPVLPGDDCLGGSLCKCSLEEERLDDGTILVHWLLDPTAESCAVCIAHAVESPYTFEPQEVEDARRH